MIFVHEGLLANASNHDELAHVLGHEMSHMICGHVEDMIQFNATTSILQLIVISLLDPTGIMGFAGEFFLLMGSTLGLVTSAYSRQNEMQADELGLIITARACFDTDKAYRFFEHMCVLGLLVCSASRHIFSLLLFLYTSRYVLNSLSLSSHTYIHTFTRI